MRLVCLILFVAAANHVYGQSCTAGQLPPQASSVATFNDRWFINHKNSSSCSGRLTSYDFQYPYGSIDINDQVYLSLWTPLGGGSYQLVENSKRLYTYTSQNSQLTVNLGDEFVYVPAGAVVGVHIPDNDSTLPLVGFTWGSSSYGLCVSPSGTSSQDTTLTCSTSNFIFTYYRLHLIANIEIIDCGNPTSITDGSFTLIDDNSTEYGSRVRYQCNDPGYTLIGNEIRFCTENATWNGTDPSCQPVFSNCGDPGNLLNGQRNGDDFTYGSSVSYECDNGYYLLGDSIITCGDNMTWNSTVNPTCNPVNCSNPGHLVNGQRIGDDFTYGSSVSYECDNGYYLLGDSIITCGDNMTWNSTVNPTCNPVNCSNPGHLVNGQRIGDDFTYGSSVSYECDNGYYLLGDSIITCGDNMTWNSTVNPTCNPVSCSDPSIPTNGGKMGNEFVYQSIVYYTCDSGYELVGDDVIECQADQIWNGSLPTCVSIICGTLVAPDNGYRIGNATYTFASIVEFNCSSGYYLTGPSVLQCMANGNWDNTVPDCLPVSCEPPPIPNNGSIVGYDSNVYYNFSTSITYQCDEGYFLNGSSVSTCQADKEWSDSVPECIEFCEDFDFPHGIKTPSSDTLLIPGTIIQLSCINGYEINGTSSIECLSNSEWNISVIPQCIASSTAKSATSSTMTSIITAPSITSSSNVAIITTAPSITSSSTLASVTTMASITTISSISSSSNMDTASSIVTKTSIIDSSSPVVSIATSITGEASIIRTSGAAYSISASSTKATRSSSASIVIGSFSSTISHTTPTTGNGSSNSSITYAGIAVAVIMGIVIAVIVAILVLCIVNKRHRGTKKYNVNSPNGHINPTINSTGVGSSNGDIAGGDVENDVYFMTAVETYEEPVKTIKKVHPESEYGHLSNATTNSKKPAKPIFMDTATYEEPVNTLKRDEPESPYGHLLYATLTDEKLHEKSTGSKAPLPDGQTNQLYMEVDGDGEAMFAETTFTSSQVRDDMDKTATNQTYMDPYADQDKEPHDLSAAETYSEIADTFTQDTLVKKRCFMPIRRVNSAIYEAPATQQDQLFTQLKKKNAKSIPKKLIAIDTTLGSGFYGKVYKATYTLSPTNAINVAVKTLHEGATEQEKIKFLQEAAVMSQFKHINVLGLHGIIVEEDSCMIVTEFMEKGDLKELLPKLKPDPGELVNAELPGILLNFNRQICMGLTYLSEKGFVHRDIAARNILVNGKNVCKVADFGLSRDLEDENYYLANKQAKVPVKWTAPEALHYRKYSSASDMWSFGCLLYEVWSLGQSPFTGVTNIESMRKVEKGYRLSPPPGCPMSIYELMIKCWHPDPIERPSFQDVMLSLLQQDRTVLAIPDEELNNDTQAGLLGAVLQSSDKLYYNLQQTYCVELTHM